MHIGHAAAYKVDEILGKQPAVLACRTSRPVTDQSCLTLHLNRYAIQPWLCILHSTMLAKHRRASRNQSQQLPSPLQTWKDAGKRDGSPVDRALGIERDDDKGCYDEDTRDHGR
jgi:hypothetical protein